MGSEGSRATGQGVGMYGRAGWRWIMRVVDLTPPLPVVVAVGVALVDLIVALTILVVAVAVVVI